MLTETVIFEGYSIEIYSDSNPENPFVVQDDLPKVYLSLGGNVVAFHSENDEVALPYDFNDALLKGQLVDEAFCMLGVYSFYEAYRLGRKLRVKDNYLSDAVNDLFAESDVEDQLKLLAAAYTALGYSTLRYTSRGHCQGDSATVLMVDQDNVTNTHKKLFNAWMWGDVFYFKVRLNGRTIDTCFGFYGADHEASGLLPSAKEVVLAHQQSAANFIQANKRKLDNIQALLDELKIGINITDHV